jgi:cytochrome b561
MKPMVENRSPATLPRYGAIAMLFHWLLAAMIVSALLLGWYMADLPFSLTRVKLFNWHKWLGMTIMLIAALRLSWRLSRPGPALPGTMARWELMLAHASHAAMYLLFFAVPLIGWARTSAAGFPIVWFGILRLPDFVGKDKALAATLAQAHAIAAYLLAALIVLHIAAALKHALVDKDGVMSRMVPGCAPPPK